MGAEQKRDAAGGGRRRKSGDGERRRERGSSGHGADRAPTESGCTESGMSRDRFETRRNNHVKQSSRNCAGTSRAFSLSLSLSSLALHDYYQLNREYLCEIAAFVTRIFERTVYQFGSPNSIENPLPVFRNPLWEDNTRFTEADDLTDIIDAFGRYSVVVSIDFESY